MFELFGLIWADEISLILFFSSVQQGRFWFRIIFGLVLVQNLGSVSGLVLPIKVCTVQCPSFPKITNIWQKLAEKIYKFQKHENFWNFSGKLKQISAILYSQMRSTILKSTAFQKLICVTPWKIVNFDGTVLV